jgi:4-amino-4-deoxy-L-arabinose transferase-like glycosyltransferase
MTIPTLFLTLKVDRGLSLRRPTILILVGALVGLIWLRTFQPLLLPMFHDEGLPISRAQRALTEHTLLVGTEGGKYLQVWLLALILPFAKDPLLAARFLSALIGLLAGAGCYLLTRQLYERVDVALVATAFYAIVPYSLFFDRMGLADGLLSALAVWSLLLSLIAVRHTRWWSTLALGLCLGLAAATKLNGVLFLAFPILVAWLWRDECSLRRALPMLLVAWLLAVPWLLPSLLDLTPQYKSTIARSWVDSAEEGIPHLNRLGQNLSTIATTLWTYLTLPYLVLALAEVVRSLRRRDKSSWLLALAALVTLTFFFLTAGVEKFYPRYILPAFPFLLIMAARSLVGLADWLWERAPQTMPLLRQGLLVGLVLLISLPALRFDYLLLTDPSRAPWLPIDRWQYVDGWPAGYGLIDAAAYLRQQADELGVIIVVKRATSEIRAGAWVHYLDQSNIIFNAINFRHSAPQELIQALNSAPAPVFVALDRPSEDPYAADFTDGPYAPYSSLVATFPRPGGASRIEVYRVQPNP